MVTFDEIQQLPPPTFRALGSVVSSGERPRSLDYLEICFKDSFCVLVSFCEKLDGITIQ